MARSQLEEDYRPYVTAIARKLHADAGARFTVEQLVEFGFEGLLEAAGGRAELGANFMTEAYYKIRGAIQDGIRRAGGTLPADEAKQLFERRANDFLSELAVENPFVDRLLADAVQGLAVVYVAATAGVGSDGLSDAQALLRKATAELNDRERKLFKLLYERELTLAEAAERMGTCKARTRRLHRRAIEKAMRSLERKLHDAAT